MAKAVAPTGKVYAVDIDQAFVDHIGREGAARRQRPADSGKDCRPALPSADVDVALFHDVLHHIQDRATYLKNTAKYIKTDGRIAIVELDPKTGSHRNEPELTISKDQAKAWLDAIRFRPVRSSMASTRTNGSSSMPDSDL